MLQRIALSVLLLLALNTAQAATSLQLTPDGGSVEARAGATVGWGFQLSNDQDFLVVTSSAFESTRTLGTFTDFISDPINFFVVGPARGGSTNWAQPFNPASSEGIGSFAIDAGATPGSAAYGTIVLSYDLFSRSPNDPLFDPDTDTLATGRLLTANASVKVGAVVPLPAAFWLMTSALGAITRVGVGHRYPAG